MSLSCSPYLRLVTTLVAFCIPGAGKTPVPRVKGPLPVTAGSYPFGAADHELVPEDLKSLGYVEEEFLVSGTANVCDWSKPGPATVRIANAPYTTRVLVRRPIDRSRFRGNVAVELLNPSNRFDLNISWALSHKEFVRKGDAWVGITAKPISVAVLKNFNPDRYKELNWANSAPLDDPRNCARIASYSERNTENGLVWEINTQTAAWLRSRDSSNPLLCGVSERSTHPVGHVYAWGFS